VAIDGLADPARLARIDLSGFAVTPPPSLPEAGELRGYPRIVP
jgi:hypothetical protein